MELLETLKPLEIMEVLVLIESLAFSHCTGKGNRGTKENKKDYNRPRSDVTCDNRRC